MVNEWKQSSDLAKKETQNEIIQNVIFNGSKKES